MARKAISETEIREALLKAATEAFLENGIMATEMKTIAARSGLSRSTLYRYAISKNQLVFLVGEQQVRLFIETALACKNDVSCTGWERLALFSENMLKLLESRSQLLRMLAEFDAIYSGPYPDIPEARDYVISMQRLCNAVNQIVLDGLADHSIVNVPNAGLFTASLVNTILGLAMRLFPREAHYVEEHHHNAHAIITETIGHLLAHVKA